MSRGKLLFFQLSKYFLGNKLFGSIRNLYIKEINTEKLKVNKILILDVFIRRIKGISLFTIQELAKICMLDPDILVKIVLDMVFVEKLDQTKQEIWLKKIVFLIKLD